MDREHPIKQRDLEDTPDVGVRARNAQLSAALLEPPNGSQQDADGHRVDERGCLEVDDDSVGAALDDGEQLVPQVRRRGEIELALGSEHDRRRVRPRRRDEEAAVDARAVVLVVIVA